MKKLVKHGQVYRPEEPIPAREPFWGPGWPYLVSFVVVVGFLKFTEAGAATIDWYLRAIGVR